LPKKNGFEVYREVRALYPTLCILFITGYSDFKSPQLDPYVLGFLQKPFSMGQLLNKIKTIKK